MERYNYLKNYLDVENFYELGFKAYRKAFDGLYTLC